MLLIAVVIAALILILLPFLPTKVSGERWETRGLIDAQGRFFEGHGLSSFERQKRCVANKKNGALHEQLTRSWPVRTDYNTPNHTKVTASVATRTTMSADSTMIF
jgi:hypothetical protein